MKGAKLSDEDGFRASWPDLDDACGTPKIVSNLRIKLKELKIENVTYLYEGVF